jgi:hypothetical protein
MSTNQHFNITERELIMKAAISACYVCSSDHNEFRRFEEGRVMPPCTCEKGRWEPLLSANARSTISVKFTGLDVDYRVDIDNLPRPGELINIVFPDAENDGLYEVRKINLYDVEMWPGKRRGLDWKKLFYKAVIYR